MDRAWVADHVLREAQGKGEGLVLKLGAFEQMTIPSEKVDPAYWLKGQEVYRDRFGRNPYFLYGIHFVPDEKQQSLF